MKDKVIAPRKLIETALPLDAINRACVREKSIRHGHPSTLHLWWARRPLAAARAVLFAQLVNDPGWSLTPGSPAEEHERAAKKRKELFRLIAELVQWENTTNETVLEKAREEIRRSWRETCALNKDHPRAAELFDPERLPVFHDPFAGGGSIPLEAQRLGLESHASDLNPVAVLINKAMIEIPPKFAGRAPVGPVPAAEARDLARRDWSGAQGLAEDVRRYGAWMREQAFRRIGHLYPRVDLKTGRPAEDGATVIAWIWARTVKSPDLRFNHVEVPLASTFLLSNKAGRESWVEPVVEGDTYRFEIRTAPKDGRPPAEAKYGTKLARGANFRCLLSGTPIEPGYIKAEGRAGRMGTRLMAVVAEGGRGRVYLPPTVEMEAVARSAKPGWKPTGDVPARLTGGTCYGYGLTTWGDLFTPRQLVALTTFADLVQEARQKVREDAIAAGWPDDGRGLEAGGLGATAYADAVAVYAGLVTSSLADRMSTICTWDAGGPTWGTKTRNTFARQAIPMSWDFAEVNPFSRQSGSWDNSLEYTNKGVVSSQSGAVGSAVQEDATLGHQISQSVISTDPPYYDNIGYADLSDFFYIWLRKALRAFFPSLFATITTPKQEELVAIPYRHGGKEEAGVFFINGMGQALTNMARATHPGYPLTIFYAFKQTETEETGTSSVGWEAFLSAAINAGFVIDGTWPMRTELGTRMIGRDTNSLASSIVLVCRKRDPEAAPVSRREFLRELKAALPAALRTMIEGAEHQSPIAPVDLAQAAIGPGMAVFTRHPAVLEADGRPMSVHTALVLINREVDEYLNRGMEQVDLDTRFCLDWFAEYGWKEGPFGQADVLARARAVSVERLERGGVLASSAGKVRLVGYAEYPAEWDPAGVGNASVWESLHQILKVFKSSGGGGAAPLLARMPERESGMRQLAYLLYTLCERNGWMEEARAYNEVIAGWQDMEGAAVSAPARPRRGMELFDGAEEQA